MTGKVRVPARMLQNTVFMGLCQRMGLEAVEARPVRGTEKVKVPIIVEPLPPTVDWSKPIELSDGREVKYIRPYAKAGELYKAGARRIVLIAGAAGTRYYREDGTHVRDNLPSIRNNVTQKKKVSVSYVCETCYRRGIEDDEWENVFSTKEKVKRECPFMPIIEVVPDGKGGWIKVNDDE